MDSIQSSRNIPFQFNGTAGEYFKIWIVNITLSILTLGIYSAWAKVRTKRYFYSNTTLDGSSFEYSADPFVILQGRLIVLGFILLYAGTIQLFPLLEFAFFAAYIIALPWVVIKSLQFKARYSAYRNIHFNFDGKLFEAAIILVGLFVLTIITLGLAFPYFIKRLNQFSIEHSYFGKSKFGIQATTGAYFKIYLKIFIIPIIGILAAIAIPAYNAYVNDVQIPIETQTSMEVIEPEADTQASTIPSQAGANTPALDPVTAIVASILPMTMSLAFYVFIWVYIQTRITNLVYNSSHLGLHEFNSNQRVRDMFALHFVNILASIISLGLLIPWAKIRLAKYKASHLTFVANDDIDCFIADESSNVKATAGEFSDVLDIDIGF